MNKLNIFLSFVLLSFCLLINVSYAEFNETPLSNGSVLGTSSGFSKSFAGYTPASMRSIVRNHLSDKTNSDYATAFDTLMLDLSNAGYNVFLLESDTVPKAKLLIGGSNTSFGAFDYSNGNINYYITYSDSSITGSVIENSISELAFADATGSVYGGSSYVESIATYFYQNNYPGSLYYSNVDVKQITYNGGPTWDGTSYYYEVPSDEPDDPTMPTNAEIASAVQLFYNSVYQDTNAFDDFFVLYDTSTKLYTYVGHTRGNALGQIIVEPNGYYEGYKFDVQWWKFFLDEQEDSWNWQNISKYSNYYVYSSEGTTDTLKNIGYSNISGLLSDGPWATSTTIIVYSTTDYPVKYITFSDDSPEPNIQTGVIEGDQYTYDENLDITDNNYNPLDSFVTIDYPSTLVSRADFEEFMNVFNENSQFAILPSNANWIVIANNSLFEHFSSFIIMCTVFIILQRFMRG